MRDNKEGGEGRAPAGHLPRGRVSVLEKSALANYRQGFTEPRDKLRTSTYDIMPATLLDQPYLRKITNNISIILNIDLVPIRSIVETSPAADHIPQNLQIEVNFLKHKEMFLIPFLTWPLSRK